MTMIEQVLCQSIGMERRLPSAKVILRRVLLVMSSVNVNETKKRND